jgi:adenosylcobinamide-GDP ribazoletransferase
MKQVTDLPNPLVERVSVEPHQPDADDRASSWEIFATAIRFLTRVPVPGPDVTKPAGLARCPIYFPVVGTLIGLVTATIILVVMQIWPIWIAVLVALAFEARLTGALHEDAVADFCDAFGGGWTRDDVLRILKDSRVGSYGVLGLVIAVGLRVAATTEIVASARSHNSMAWYASIVAGSAISRLVVVYMMASVLPVANRDSLSRDIGRRLSVWDALIATLWALPAAIWFGSQAPFQALGAAVALMLLSVWFSRLVQRRLQGTTGDCLGFLGYAAHLVILLAAAARWPQ